MSRHDTVRRHGSLFSKSVLGTYALVQVFGYYSALDDHKKAEEYAVRYSLTAENAERLTSQPKSIGDWVVKGAGFIGYFAGNYQTMDRSAGP